MIIADTNEFHPLADAATYRDAREADGTNHPVVIMRATYSTYHVDTAYAVSVARARAAGLRIGHYGYMVAGADAAAQGTFFAQTVKAHGGLQPGDSIWCDDEEGAGNQVPRAGAFLAAAHAVLHDSAADEGVYSGAAFWQAHLGSLPSGVHRWVAAYGQADPKLPGEDLWQFTSSRAMAGVSGPCDASVFNGTLTDFMNLVGGNVSANGPQHWDAADWTAFVDHVWHTPAVSDGAKTRWPSWVLSTVYQSVAALTIPAIAKAIAAQEPTVDAIAAAVVAALPPAAAGGLTVADVEGAVKAVFAQAAQ